MKLVFVFLAALLIPAGPAASPVTHTAVACEYENQGFGYFRFNYDSWEDFSQCYQLLRDRHGAGLDLESITPIDDDETGYIVKLG